VKPRVVIALIIIAGTFAGCSSQGSASKCDALAPGAPPPTTHLDGPGAPKSHRSGVPVFQVHAHQSVTFRVDTSDRVTAVDLAVVGPGVQPGASDHDNLLAIDPDVIQTVRRVGSVPSVVLRYRPAHIGSFPLLERIEYNPPPGPCIRGGTGTAESTAAYIQVVG
jgi:hypothetical protein